MGGLDFLRTKQFPFVPNTDRVENIKLGIVTKEQDDDSISSLAASVTKPSKEQGINQIPFDKFSSYQKLLRVTAYMIRLLPSHESYRTVDGSIPDTVEIDEAERHLQYLVQGESFNIVLDGRHTFVKLFLRHTHLKNHHQGIDYLISKVQERYAILKLRSILHSIKSNCILCRKFRAATTQPIMAEFPKKRLAYQSPPFTNTGVDYFDPFYVAVRRTTEKRWGFRFTCLTTRAVHVDVVPSMDTSSCVMGVEGFVSRRGTPAMIWSDNGTNFIGAEKELCECIEKWNTFNIATELAHKGIKWRFNPPSAPHQGGIWERLVRSFKIVLYTILGTPPLYFIHLASHYFLSC